MPSTDGWRIPRDQQPGPDDVRYDLDRALSAVVNLRALVPADAFTAETLGTERAGQGVVIREDGLVLTIGYLIAEASEVWLDDGEGRPVLAHPVAYDYETGFGLVQALQPLGVPPLVLGDARKARPGVEVVVAGAGGRTRSLLGQIVARQEFAGYWEYLLEDAIFTAPAHPHWGGTALIGPAGDLLGIGSLQLQHQAAGGWVVPLNMMVPVDHLKPILDDLLTIGRARRPARPWLGLFAAEDEGSVVVIGLAGRGPAGKAELRQGDVIRAVGGAAVESLLGFYRTLWGLGEAGVEVPLTLEREGDVFDLVIRSDDRTRFLKTPPLH
ncbi:S1C family serine protease [Salinarimonas soli]|uniref:Serine protease n=1 Tax=Salinarimonas soli TaxID=1638099 RepID=A0A5B2VQQ5_9HYPH|nr:S1C family serine protease [Salinarimonas soli]KAA2242083.1 serine protease [Salinarimonas soli]